MIAVSGGAGCCRSLPFSATLLDAGGSSGLLMFLFLRLGVEYDFTAELLSLKGLNVGKGIIIMEKRWRKFENALYLNTFKLQHF